MKTETTPATWTLESLPERQITGAPAHPGMTDQDHAVSAPRVLVADTTERQARQELVLHLIRERSYTDRYPWQKERPLYDAAITAVETGAAMVHVANRVYRLRDVTLCAATPPYGLTPHSPYQICVSCTPCDYPSFTTVTLTPAQRTAPTIKES